jgi:hypothetical protein
MPGGDVHPSAIAKKKRIRARGQAGMKQLLTRMTVRTSQFGQERTLGPHAASSSSTRSAALVAAEATAPVDVPGQLPPQADCGRNVLDVNAPASQPGRTGWRSCAGPEVLNSPRNDRARRCSSLRANGALVRFDEA